MSKSMKTIKTKLASVGIKPTNRNARNVLHRSRRLLRMLRAESKRVNSLVPRYELPDDSEEEHNG